MKTNLTLMVLAAVCLLFAGLHTVSSDDASSPAKWEYVRIHWGGWDNTSICRPDGTAERLRTFLHLVRHDCPEPADDRAYYMNLAVNGLAKQGYEVVTMTDGDVIMKRAAVR